MTLFLQNDPGGTGSGGVFPDRGFMDLTQIAHLDTGIGQDAPVGDLIPVTYARTLSGIPPERLDTLVNTDFPDVGSTVDIIVIPVDGSFVRTNGHFVTENAGLTFPVGSSENPTSSVLIIYDTSDNNGNGYCLPAEGGGTVGFPSSVILYHELSHALRDATSSQLDNSDTGCTANPEEHQAEIDENDMRDQLGVDHRDTTQHCTTSGCTTNCCVVASIATGSPYSSVLTELRRLRDQSLRGSEVGFDFFEHLHYDYYGFSPEVCRMMENADELRAFIAGLFVVPLLRSLELARSHAASPHDVRALGALFEEQVALTPELAGLSREHVTEAALVLGQDMRASDGWPSDLAALRDVVCERAAGSPFIQWGLLDPVRTYVAAMLCRFEGAGCDEIGRYLALRLEEWGAALPLTDVWRRLSRYAMRNELLFLSESLLPTPEARSRFATRLVEHLDGGEDLRGLLEGCGYALEAA